MEIKHGLVVDGHLGGYVPGGDPCSITPTLWDWLIETNDVSSMIDVGCGDGVAVRWFRDRGIDAEGVDGMPVEGSGFFQADFTLGAFAPGRHYDLVWSCEFVEHVEERYVSNFLSTFACGRMVAMTHGEPGQPGWHHVNNQTSDYWIDMLASIGLTFEPESTVTARSLAALDHPDAYFAKTGLIFRKDDA